MATSAEGEEIGGGRADDFSWAEKSPRGEGRRVEHAPSGRRRSDARRGNGGAEDARRGRERNEGDDEVGKSKGGDVADTFAVCAHAPASPGDALGTTVESLDRDAKTRGRVLEEAARRALVVAEAEMRSTTRPRAVDAPRGTACERRTAEVPERSGPRPRRTPLAGVTTAPRGAPRVRACMGAKPVASGFRARRYRLRVEPRRPNARGAECGRRACLADGEAVTHTPGARAARILWSTRFIPPLGALFSAFLCAFRHPVDRYSSVKS